MMLKNAEFIRQLDDIITRVEALNAALRSLPREIVITVRYEEVGRPDILNSAVTQTVNVNRIVTGGENLPPATQNIREQFSDVGGQMGRAAAQAAAIRDLVKQMQEGTITSREFISAEKELTSSQFMAANMAARQANAQAQAAQQLHLSADEAHNLAMDNLMFIAGIENLTRDLAASNKESVSFGARIAAIGAAAAGIGIPINAAAFGITGLATAIHLIVMGSAEFLAVFLPAMYAAAAGAAVMLQAGQQVVQRISAIYTVTEAIGPSLNTTAGDFLGLGHSLQVAQNMASPGTYELLGLAIQAVNNYTGGAKTTLSEFGKTGLGVVSMLDQFGAKVAADMAGPLGGTLHSLVSKAVDDLRTFGAILGNLLHAIANLAAAMPGLAEVLLHVVNGFAELIKWVSQLPTWLLTAIFVIEEMYRWSGILVGVFGLLGKAIALVGTLGIPALLQIGKNFALMAVGIIDGMAGLVANLGKGVATIVALFSAGLGDRIGTAVSGLVGKLGVVAEFLKGPWGIAIGLGIVAIGAMVFWMSKWKSATQEFVDSSNRAVQAASNLQALNVIAQQSTATTQKLTEQQSALGKATQSSVAGVDAITGRLTGQYKPAIDQAIGASNELTQHQQQLGQEAANVVQGAAAISQKYGVTYPEALAIADLAGVKLAGTQVNFADSTNKAAIQIEALINSYGIMNSKSGMLVNGINAVNLQMGLQASQIQKYNSAWDSFIKMSTSVTSTFSSFQADLTQMGNIAPVVGSKIRAFSGQTALSLSQVQQALTTFGGQSNQVWQSFDQSITAANSFLDQMRTAQSLNVITAGQMSQAVGGIVQQLIPYASQSKAALAQVMALAQEAGGPAYTASKSLAQNYQALTDWTGKVGGKTTDWNGILTKTTIGLSDVGKLAAQFANTLQSDVINAIAGAAAQTGKVTQDTLAYIKALQTYGATSPQAMNAQAALTQVMNAAHIPTKDQNQITSDLATTYGKKLPASTAQAGGAMDTLKNGHLAPLGVGVDTANGKMQNLAKYMTGGLQSAMNQTGATADNLKNSHLAPLGVGVDTVHNKSQQLAQYFTGQLQGAMNTTGSNANTLNNNHLNPLQNRFQNLTTWAGNLTGAIQKIPANHSVAITESGKGTFTISQLASAGGLGVVGIPVGVKKAAGGKIPGFGGGDTVPALLEPGEAVVPKHLVSAVAPFLSAHRVPGFASGGYVDSYNGSMQGLPNWTTSEYNKSVNYFTSAMESAMSSAMKAAEAQAAAAAAAAISTAGVASGSGVAAMKSAAAKFGWNTGAEWAALNYVEMREAGYSLTARNPSSGAYGMAQFINGPSEYYTYGGNPNTYAGQAVAMLNYIRQRYGNPINAAAHERAYNWYDKGGWLPPGLSLAMNNTGAPERVVGPGGGGGEPVVIHNIVELDGKKVWENQQQYTYKYNLRNTGSVTGTVAPRRLPGRN